MEKYCPISAKIWVSLIEASVEQLLAFDFSRSPLPPPFERYRQALLCFHRGDSERLLNLVVNHQESVSFPGLHNLLKLRLGILTGNFPERLLEECFANAPSQPYAGEHWIVMAAAFETKGDYAKALDLHRKAARSLAEAGANGKALRARFNSVTNLSNIEPDRKLIPEYLYLYKEARRQRQFNVAATALLNLSREYQKIGALQTAIKFCNRSIASCKDNLAGQTYFLAHVHRGHILLDLGRTAEARLDLEFAKTSDFLVVKSACSVLATLMGNKSSTPERIIHNTWRERLNSFTNEPGRQKLKLSSLEERLIQFISERPRDKFAITDHLFGKELHPLTAENRLKNLLFRLRKKIPGLIILSNDRYSIADFSFKREVG